MKALLVMRILMMRILMMKIIILSLIVVTFSTSVQAGIQGSKHDFSGEGWSGGEICLPCHTPHNANMTVSGSPIWNHQVTGSTFVVYSSPTMKTTPNSPQGVSKLCLSCHDGSIAVDSYGSRTGSININSINPAANLGFDLSNDHPVSIYWSHQNDFQNGTCIKCHNPNPSNFNPILPLYNRYIECATCHDVHNQTTNPKLLRLPLQNSELCFHCHGK